MKRAKYSKGRGDSIAPNDHPPPPALRLCFRVIGDLTVLNDCGEFGRGFRETYLPKLELKKENI